MVRTTAGEERLASRGRRGISQSLQKLGGVGAPYLSPRLQAAARVMNCAPLQPARSVCYASSGICGFLLPSILC
jgi:hypothetical protein